ncbi:MAG TPA: thioredoxin domain-containing protein [Candidatus Limnocylindrales bacterium]|nr:thioredoxin domain-containing protein [Candidatus Limnocylindrales bacterium]
MRHHVARPAQRQIDRRPPLSGKTPNQQTTRRDRRAAERQDRFAADRDARKARSGSGGGKGSGGFLNTTTIMIGATVVGVLIVVFVAFQQLGGRSDPGTFSDPGINYPAAILDGTNLGDADAPVTLEVWEDYQCPVCARHTLSVEPILVEQYVKDGTLRIEKRDLAFLGTGNPSESEVAASGAVCADRQGKYWPYTLWMYNNQDGENAGGFSPERVKGIAEAAGVDVTDWDACMADPEVIAEVRASTQEGVNLGVNSTPSMFLNGTLVDPPGLRTAEELGQLIEAAAANAAPASPAASEAPASATP